MGGDNWEKYARGNGSYWSFGIGNAGILVVASPANVSATLVQTPSNFVITFQNGETRQFSLTTGLLTAIVDRNGNTTQLSYDSSNRLTTVTSPASQHLYFNYGSGATANLVTSVTSDAPGFSWTYSYNSQGLLSQVTRPDTTTLNLAYNSLFLITSVTDSQGKLLESHTYDSFGRGLTSSRANGVEAVTVSYGSNP
jgi:YD repeat-containing protein